MKVTEVRISPSKGGGKIRAFASIVIDDCFIVNDLRVVEGREGQMFVTMPARKTRNGQMRDIAHPLDSDTRQQIEREVLGEYEQAVRNLVVPDAKASARRPEHQSLFDRLATRLFSEDYWVAEPNQQEEGKD